MKRGVCIEEAVGVLMECFGIEAAEANAILKSWSADQKTPVTTIAHVLVHQIWRGDERTEDRELTRALEESLRQLPKSAV
ncbi:ANTAR domain-containing protein [Kribbella swartbergensis]